MPENGPSYSETFIMRSNESKVSVTDTENTMAETFNDTTQRILRPSDDPADVDSDAIITSFRGLASYNWLDRPNPSILVPGKHFLPWQSASAVMTDRAVI